MLFDTFSNDLLQLFISFGQKVRIKNLLFDMCVNVQFLFDLSESRLVISVFVRLHPIEKFLYLAMIFLKDGDRIRLVGTEDPSDGFDRTRQHALVLT